MKESKKIAFSAMFLAVGVVLPYLTGQIKEIGDTLLPMHLPVILCGFISGGKYGLIVGLILPLLRAIIVGMPPVYPNAVWMSFEIGTYGLVSGLMWKAIGKDKLWKIYSSLVVAMLSGRIVWGVAKAVLLGIAGKSFTISAFIAGGFLDAIPGIILQLVLVPAIVFALEKMKK